MPTCAASSSTPTSIGGADDGWRWSPMRCWIARSAMDPAGRRATMRGRRTPMDPTGPCPGVDIKTWHSYEAVGPRGIEALTQGDDPLPCYADPQWIADKGAGEPLINPA